MIPNSQTEKNHLGLIPTHASSLIAETKSIDNLFQDTFETEPIKSYLPYSKGSLLSTEKITNTKDNKSSSKFFSVICKFVLGANPKNLQEPTQDFIYQFIQKNVLVYIPFFQAITNKKKLYFTHFFSSGAFFFGPVWFAYRRMYKLAVLGLLFNFAFAYVGNQIYNRFFAEVYPNWFSYIIHFPTYYIHKEIYFVIIQLLPMIMFGFIGKWLYYIHIKIAYNKLLSSSKKADIVLPYNIGSTSMLAAFICILLNLISFPNFFHILHVYIY